MARRNPEWCGSQAKALGRLNLGRGTSSRMVMDICCFVCFISLPSSGNITLLFIGSLVRLN